MPTIDLSDLSVVHLDVGTHKTPDQGLCLMELAAALAGEPHTDTPACVEPVLAGTLRAINDHLDDQPRQRLIPLVPWAIGTAGDGRGRDRAWLVADWLIRDHLPRLLHAAGLPGDAQRLATRPPLPAGPGAVGVLRRLHNELPDIDRTEHTSPRTDPDTADEIASAFQLDQLRLLLTCALTDPGERFPDYEQAALEDLEDPLGPVLCRVTGVLFARHDHDGLVALEAATQAALLDLAARVLTPPATPIPGHVPALRGFSEPTTSPRKEVRPCPAPSS